MARKKLTMPSSSGGLVRYYDEDTDAIRIDPKWVVGAIGFLVILEVFLHLYGNAFLGTIV